jgi:hypothetical protein
MIAGPRRAVAEYLRHKSWASPCIRNVVANTGELGRSSW